MKKIFLPLLLIAVVVFLVFINNFASQSKPVGELVPTPLATPTGEPTVEAVATNLEIPWELAFLSDDKIIFTERPGRVRILDTATHEISDVAHSTRFLTEVGEGGLLGLALHPSLEYNNYVYLYYTYKDGGSILNKVQRFKLSNNLLQPDKQSLSSDKVIIDRIPAATNHNGGRIKFGPDGKLYITSGDAGNPVLSQDTDSLAGKILRLNEDGSIPPDNPFGNAVWSYGHRNPQGLAWDSNGQLWITEHGSRAFDEINRVEKGKNYGWPDIRGDQQKEGMETPFIHSGNTTWAPSGAVVYENSLFFAGLRGGAIFELNLETQELKEHFKNQFGRIRTVTLGPDGFFYILTSNRDGRGAPISEDDRIIKIHPSLLR